MAFSKEDLDRYLFERGWEPVTTSQVDFHNYRRVNQFGMGNYAITSVCLQPDVMTEYGTPAELYNFMISNIIAEN